VSEYVYVRIKHILALSAMENLSADSIDSLLWRDSAAHAQQDRKTVIGLLGFEKTDIACLVCSAVDCGLAHPWLAK
jgi:hypothetical protein